MADRRRKYDSDSFTTTTGFSRRLLLKTGDFSNCEAYLSICIQRLVINYLDFGLAVIVFSQKLSLINLFVLLTLSFLRIKDN